MAQRKRFQVVLIEVFFVFAILGSLIAILVPSVNQDGVGQGEPQILPIIPGFDVHNRWSSIQEIGFIPLTGMITGAIGLAVALGIRRLLPSRFQDRFIWFQPPQPKKPPKPVIPDMRPALRRWRTAIASILVCGSATGLLLFAASHIRVDGSHRRPAITWVGPAADWVGYLAVAGWSLSFVGFMLAIHATCEAQEQNDRRQEALGVLGAFMAVLNVFGSCLFNAAVYED